MCNAHYMRQYRAAHRKPIEPFEKRFWALVSKSDGCWLWMGRRQSGRWDYGNVIFNGRHAPAHRVAWILTYGEIPTGRLICHKCDNPPCVRPDHLFLGTPKSNMDDMVMKNRHKIAGCASPKLTESAVRIIRQRREAGESCAALGREFGASRTVVSLAARRKKWRWVI